MGHVRNVFFYHQGNIFYEAGSHVESIIFVGESTRILTEANLYVNGFVYFRPNLDPSISAAIKKIVINNLKN